MARQRPIMECNHLFVEDFLELLADQAIEMDVAWLIREFVEVLYLGTATEHRHALQHALFMQAPERALKRRNARLLVALGGKQRGIELFRRGVPAFAGPHQ